VSDAESHGPKSLKRQSKQREDILHSCSCFLLYLHTQRIGPFGHFRTFSCR
uniref:Uncharacterized protein n=1 Tax=Sander lucioperca TaxID=283035 RepID=A0A8D0DDB0_SANLU